MNQEITEQQQKFIELKAKQPFNNMTNVEIADMLGVSTKTVQRWTIKFEKQITAYSMENIGSLKGKMLQTSIELLNSSKSSDKKIGLDSIMKLDSMYQLEQSANTKQAEIEKASRMMGMMLEALQINNKAEAKEFSHLIASLMVQIVNDDCGAKYREEMRHLTVHEMLDSLAL